MAKSVKTASPPDHEDQMPCSCLHPAIQYLEDKLLTDESIAKLSETTVTSQTYTTLFSAKPLSVMYTGGTIRPLTDGKADTIVESIGFHDGKVVAVGTTRKVTSTMDGLGVKYTSVNLSKGHTLLPGLIEPHVHIVPTALMHTWHDFGPFDGQDLHKSYDVTYLKDKIEEAKKTHKKGHWIIGHGVDPSLMPFTLAADHGLNTLQNFNVNTVDGIEKEIPVFMMSASGHTGYVNTTALFEIYDKVKPSGYDTFEEYRKYVNGQGGLQQTKELDLAIRSIPPLQLGEIVLGAWKGLNDIFNLAIKRGVTLMYDAAMTFYEKKFLDLYFLKFDFGSVKKVRVGYAKIVSSVKKAKEIEQWKPVTDVDKIYQGAVKIISDGSNQGLTGYQFEPYHCVTEPPNSKGIFNFRPVEDFNEMVKVIVSKGWPLMIHGNGNRAIDNILTAYAGALGDKSGTEKRHRLEHASLLSDDALKKMKELGISPSFLIGHVGYWGYTFNKAIFEEKSQILDRTQSALVSGMRITLHSDYFVSPLGPLRMMEQAVTRIMEQDPHKGVLNEDEKLTRAQALRAITYDAAWQCHADQWVGSLEVGKKADYVILGEDPITRKDAVGIRNIPVLETWVGGVRTGTLTVTPV